MSMGASKIYCCSRQLTLWLWRIATICCGCLLASGYGTAQEFDAAQFKTEVTDSYKSTGAPVLVERLAKRYDAYGLSRASDPATVQRFYSELLKQIKFNPAEDIESERAYLDVVSRFLAGRDVWSTENTRQATDQLGNIAMQLRQSTGQAHAELAGAVDDAISKADNMYISALRFYDPNPERMRALIEGQLVPLLDIDYVKASSHSASIRAMISAKYIELALLEANYDQPLCGSLANLDKPAIDKSAKYAQDLVDDIDAGNAASAAGIRNDLLYHLLQVAALSCDKVALLRYSGLLVSQQSVHSDQIPDQVYVFRHLRTKRTTTSKLVWVKTDKGDEQTPKTKPDQTDVVRAFFNPWQISMYFCNVALATDSLSISSLKADLDAFENVDFWVTVELPATSSRSPIDLAQQFSAEFNAKRQEILAEVKRKMGDETGASASQKILNNSDHNRCGKFMAVPADRRYENILTDTGFRIVQGSGEGRPSRRFRIGQFFSFDEAKVIRDTLREAFPEWSVTLGRPRVTS